MLLVLLKLSLLDRFFDSGSYIIPFFDRTSGGRYHLPLRIKSEDLVMIQDVILPPAPLPHRALPKKGPAAGDIPLKRAWLTAVFGPLFRNSSYKIGSVATNLDEIHPPRLTRGFRKNGMTGGSFPLFPSEFQKYLVVFFLTRKTMTCKLYLHGLHVDFPEIITCLSPSFGPQNEFLLCWPAALKPRFYQNSQRKFRHKTARNAGKVAGQALTRFLRVSRSALPSQSVGHFIHFTVTYV